MSAELLAGVVGAELLRSRERRVTGRSSGRRVAGGRRPFFGSSHRFENLSECDHVPRSIR